jgi:hypothetical protein
MGPRDVGLTSSRPSPESQFRTSSRWIKKIPNLKAFQSADTAKNEIMEYLSY